MWSGLFGGGVACVYVAYNYTTWGWVGMGGMGRADETFVTPNKMATQPFPPNFHMEGFTPISALLFGLLYSRFSCAQLWAIHSFGSSPSVPPAPVFSDAEDCFKYLFEILRPKWGTDVVRVAWLMYFLCRGVVFIAFKLRSLHSWAEQGALPNLFVICLGRVLAQAFCFK